MAKLSKQHYQVIAELLTQAKLTPNEHYAFEWLAPRLANIFERDNPRFNRTHFLAVVRGERAVNSRPPRS